MRADFRGIVLAWGRQNRGREHSLNPVNFNCFVFNSCSCLLLTCKDNANNQKLQPIWLSMIF
jgi:hypothetical protein